MLSIRLCATDVFTLKRCRGNMEKKVLINRTFMNCEETIPIPETEHLYGLAINGSITKKSKDYLVRVVLCDTEGNEYLVLETYEEINDAQHIRLKDYCEESILLNGIRPKSLKVYTYDADFLFDNIVEVYSKEEVSDKNKEFKSLWAIAREKQVEQIVEKINTYNFQHKRLWGAAITNVSLLPWMEKKNMIGTSYNNYDARGFEYYASGVFEYGKRHSIRTIVNRAPASGNTSFPSSFDWRNRHGKNWMTSVKDQFPGKGCWAFAPVGVTEAVTNLYFNQDLALDLSEQEVISCSNCGTNANGGHYEDAFQWIADNGIYDENAFPFVNTDTLCPNTITNFQEHISFDNIVMVQTYPNEVDSVKKYIITKGPLLSGYPGHAMPLLGFKTIQAGDTIRIYGGDKFFIVENDDNRIGQTYWVYKNSYGTDRYYEHEGYAYIYFDDTSNILTPYFVQTPVYSYTKTDNDIICEDADGDGLYFWGIGPKPNNCPFWVPDTPDGDDSDINNGSLDEYGNLINLSPSGITIDTSITYNTNNTISSRIGVVKNGILTITGISTMTNDAIIRVCENGTLIIDGGTLQNAKLELIPGSHIIIRNNGVINMASGNCFEASKGVVLDIDYGNIN